MSVATLNVEDGSSARSQIRWIVGLTVLGVAVRFVFLLLARDIEPYADESSYLYLALLWNRTSVYSDGVMYLWQPGYPFFLAVFLRLFEDGGVFAAKLCQVLLSGVIGLTVMLFALRLASARAMRVAGLIWCFYLPLIGFSHYLWPETLYLALFMPGLYLLFRWWEHTPRESASNGSLAAAGLLIGASLLVKEVGLWWCLLVFVLIVCRDWRTAARTALSRAALFVLAVAVVMAPWALRNYEVYGRFALGGGTLGQNVHLGLNGFYLNHDYMLEEPEDVTRTNATVHRWLTTAPAPSWKPASAPNILDAAALNVRQGLQYCRENPGFAARSRIKKLADWATPLSFFVRHYRVGRYEGVMADSAVRKVLLAAALLAPMLVLAGAVGGFFFRLRGSSGHLLGWTVLYFALAGSLIVAMSRYRICIEPLLIVLAATFFSGVERISWKIGATIGCVIGWVVLAGLWGLNAAEILAMVRGVW